MRVGPTGGEVAQPTQHATQLRFLLHKVGLVSLLGQDRGGGHTSDATTNDQRLLNDRRPANLQWLDLRDTRVTNAGVAVFQEALPHCQTRR